MSRRSGSRLSGRSRSLRPVWVTAVTAFLLFLVSNGAVANNGDLDEALQLPFSEATILPIDRDVTITWRAKSTDGSVRFRLYRGINAGSVELVAEMNGVPGTISYRVEDELDFSGPVFYELRVVINEGTEKPLATATCLIPTIEPASGMALPSTHDQVALSILPVVPSPSAERMAQGKFEMSTGFIPEPQRPPPRS